MKQNWIKKYKQPDPRGIEPPTGNRIGNLDPSIPFTTDPISQGDDHIRATKRALQGSFPIIGDNPVTLTAEQINHTYARFSIGMMMYFDDTIAPIPFGWAPCDGNKYNEFQTVNLDGMFIKSNGENVIGFPGGFDSHTPAPTPVFLSEAQTPNHSHTASINTGISGGDVGSGDSGSGFGYSSGTGSYPTSSVWGGADGVTADSHTHAITTFNNQPAYMTMSMIVFVGFEPPII